MAIIIRRGLHWRTRASIIDKMGRYVMLAGILGGHPIRLITIYGQNTDDPAFSAEVWRVVDSLVPGAIIWGRDYNVVLDDAKDRSGESRCPHPRAAAQLQVLIRYGQLKVIWHHSHPVATSGTCMMTAGPSWLRIDYRLISRDSAAWAVEVRHLPCTLSDHAPIMLVLEVPDYPTRAFAWKLPVGALETRCFAKLYGRR